MKKRWLSAILTVLLLISLLVIPVSAEEYSGSCGENATWTFDPETGTLTISGTGVVKSISGSSYDQICGQIVHMVVEEGITEIADGCFPRLYALKSLTLPNSLTVLGKSAFWQCEELKEIHFGNGLKTLGESAFNSCFSLESVVIPHGVTSAGMSVFADCGLLAEISIPTSLKQIPPGFLRFTAISKIFISKEVTTVGQAAFNRCNKLTDVYYDGTQAQWEAIDIVLNGGYNDQLLNATIHFEHSHTFDSGTVTSQATCQQEGVKTYTCTVCGFVKQESYSASHQWDNGTVTPAKCTEKGKTVYTCTVCRDTKEEPISALGHSWDTGTVNADTTVTYKCAKCSQTKTEGTPVIPTEPTVPENTEPEDTVPETTPSVIAPAPEQDTDPTDSETAEPVPQQGEPAPAVPKKTFPWGIVIAVAAGVVAVAAVVTFVVIKKKRVTQGEKEEK